jgi:protocatechuate 3,4-dioxygenase beta subunit
MKGFLFALLVLAQAGPQSVGVVTGVVRGANGMPAPGIRVYAIGVRDSLEALKTGTAPLEGLTQTDATGRYRLEVTPGRYYVATGSVNSPTFYPGTANAAEARVVTVASGGLVEAIDFSSFVPASRSPSGFVTVPRGTGVVSGVIRFPDGTPAAGIPVLLISAASVSSGGVPPLLQILQPNLAGAAVGTPSQTISITLAGMFARFFTTTDLNGRYGLASLPADSFYLAAGYAESPTLYPGVRDLASAQTIAVTATTNLNTLDLTVPRPPTGSATIRGRVTTSGDAPASGVRVDISSPTPPAPSPLGLPALSPNRFVDSSGDGRFEFAGVRAGSYTVTASYSALYSESRKIVVTDQPVEGLDFLLRASALSGRILDESGNPLPDVALFADAVVSTVSNPNIVASTVFPIANDGSFGRILEPEEYRFFLRTLPEEYSIKSITADGMDLMKGTLKFTGNVPVKVDVRVGKRATPSGSSDPSAVSVRGRSTDALSAVPSVAGRITLCCRDSGPVERFSTPLKADGSFEFTAIPPGRYAVGHQPKTGTPNLFVVGRDIVVGTDNVSGFEVLSTPQFAELSARLVLEDGSLPPDGFSATVVFVGTNGRVQVAGARSRDGNYVASVPAGDRYTVSVTGLPAGYAVKSSSTATEARPLNYPQVGVPPPLNPIIITLTRESR